MCSNFLKRRLIKDKWKRDKDTHTWDSGDKVRLSCIIPWSISLMLPRMYAWIRGNTFFFSSFVYPSLYVILICFAIVLFPLFSVPVHNINITRKWKVRIRKDYFMISWRKIKKKGWKFNIIWGKKTNLHINKINIRTILFYAIRRRQTCIPNKISFTGIRLLMDLELPGFLRLCVFSSTTLPLCVLTQRSNNPFEKFIQT